MADRQAVMSEALDTAGCDQPPGKKNTKSVSPILVSLIALVHGWFALFDRFKYQQSFIVELIRVIITYWYIAFNYLHDIVRYLRKYEKVVGECLWRDCWRFSRLVSHKMQ